MKVSIIVPVYNEQERVLDVLKSLVDLELEDYEIVVVDDGSSDRTPRIMKVLEDHDLFTMIWHQHNMGKGAALRSGIKAAAGDVVCFFDADMEYDPADIPRVLVPFRKHMFRAVYGSRFLRKNDFLLLSRIANRILSCLSSLILRQRITDMETGIKAFRREIFFDIDLEQDRFGIEPEITCKVKKAGNYIDEIPISYHPRTEAQGKKIRPSDGFKALWYLLKYGVFNG